MVGVKHLLIASAFAAQLSLGMQEGHISNIDDSDSFVYQQLADLGMFAKAQIYEAAHLLRDD